jgi:predicted MPP superfamily phosphohydrolase
MWNPRISVLPFSPIIKTHSLEIIIQLYSSTMMPATLFLFFLLSLVGSSISSPSLSFRSDGTFKILHISDVHYVDPDAGQNASTCPASRCQCYDLSDSEKRYPCGASNSTSFIKRLISEEDPDFVAFTGDLVDGRAHDAKFAFNAVVSVATEAGVPWGFVSGNHDPFSVARGEEKIGGRKCTDPEHEGVCREKVMEMASDMDGSLAQVNK